MSCATCTSPSCVGCGTFIRMELGMSKHHHDRALAAERRRREQEEAEEMEKQARDVEPVARLGVPGMTTQSPSQPAMQTGEVKRR